LDGNVKNAMAGNAVIDGSELYTSYHGDGVVMLKTHAITFPGSEYVGFLSLWKLGHTVFIRI
jgi:hypothetical protein